jgi:2-methylcitrate dehydratase PrpD
VGATEEIAKFIAAADLGNVPDAVRDKAVLALTDCLGCALGGARTPAVAMVLHHIRECGGAPQAGIIGNELKTSLPDAALANGLIASALLYDDTSLAMHGHSTATLLPVLLALGERLHKSGRDLLEAYLVGFEVEAVVGWAVEPEHYERGWHATATVGALGAAASACRLMGLPTDTVRMALGIAASMAGGSRQNFGTMTQALHGGLPARSGLVAADLAARGFTADPNILESRMGFFAIFGPDNRKVEAVTAGLGREWALQRPVLAMKLYPCGFPLHRPIEGTIELAVEHDIGPEAVEEVRCDVHYLVPETVFHHDPQTGLEGKTSIAYCVARSLLDRRIGLAQFTDEKVRDPAARRLMARVRVEVPPELSAEAARGRITAIAAPATVTITLRDGTVLSKVVKYYRGDPNRPLTEADVADKFRDCASTVLDAERTETLLRAVTAIESLKDTADLVRLATP